MEWGSSCCAYNLQIGLDERQAQRIADVQDDLGRDEPGLLRVPRHALHVSVAWVLPVHEEFELPKNDVWERNRRVWVPEIRDLVGSVPEFGISLDRVAVTGSAVIATASDGEEVNRIRDALRNRLAVPWDICRGDLVHVTLFRHSGALADAVRFRARADETRLGLDVPVREIRLLREDVFPSLKSEALDGFPLKPAGCRPG